MKPLTPLRYFNVEDYEGLDAEGKAIVDQWLKDNDAEEGVSLIQELVEDQKVLLVLSGPKESQFGTFSAYDREELKRVENTFPWEVLEKVSS